MLEIQNQTLKAAVILNQAGVKLKTSKTCSILVQSPETESTHADACDYELAAMTFLFTVPDHTLPLEWEIAAHEQATEHLKAAGFKLHETEGPLINGAFVFRVGAPEAKLLSSWRNAAEICQEAFRRSLFGGE